MNKRFVTRTVRSVVMIACLVGFLTIGVISLGAQEAEENKTQTLYTSATGLRVEQNGNQFWVTFSKGERAKLPVELPQDPEEVGNLPDEFHASPNQEWIFAPHHVGSCLRDGDVFHRNGSANIDRVEDFNGRMWENAVKLGEFARDFASEGQCHMVDFECWSSDSGRLLLMLRGGEDKREMKHRRIYFNTRAQKFELTDYLRRLNKTKAEFLACAEPVNALPSANELKSRYADLDGQLNKRYAELIAKTDRERVSNVRDAQRSWIKHRDEGAKFYVSLFPPVEKEQRRLQFLCDVTAARIETQPDEAWEL